MKKLTTYSLLLPVVLVLIACSKGKNEDIIPNPAEGEYDVIGYNADNQVVFTRKGNAQYINLTNYGTQIRMDDPDFITQAATHPNDVFASIVLQGKQIINSPVVLSGNDFNVNMQQRWYSLVDDWGYRLLEGSLKIQEVAPRKLLGEFTITLTKTDHANPKWGDSIIIKGKFYATCDYGC